MGGLSSTEQAAVERAAAEPMLDQVLAWAAVNSGSRNLDGLASDGRPARPTPSRRFPGERRAGGCRRRSRRSTPRAGRSTSQHGRNLHLTVRPDAPVQLLFTGHMDTVFAADHAFQETRWLEDGVLNGPGRRRHEGRDRGDARGAEGGRGEPASRRASAMKS